MAGASTYDGGARQPRRRDLLRLLPRAGRAVLAGVVGIAVIDAAMPVAVIATTGTLISHRFSTVRRAQRICVLAGGRVTEDGTHAELLAAGGTYARMFGLQASRFDG